MTHKLPTSEEVAWNVIPSLKLHTYEEDAATLAAAIRADRLALLDKIERRMWTTPSVKVIENMRREIAPYPTPDGE